MLPAIYQTTRSPKSNDFYFTTETGIVYHVYFDTKTGSHPDEDIDRHTIYMGFKCIPKQDKKTRVHDPKVGSTIMWIVANMFKEHKHSIISYVCSPEDGLARPRLVTFGKWYNESPLKEKIKHIPKRIDNDNCFGIMFNRKHPHLEKIELSFEEFEPDDKFGPDVEELEPIDLNDWLEIDDSEEE